MNLVLASTSPYRKALLERLGLEFATVNPDVDETPLDGESAKSLVRRLARAKATAGLERLGGRASSALVIGSDQCAVLDGQILGKPGGHEANVHQLTQVSGRNVRFLTGLCLLNGATSRAREDVVPFDVTFARLDAQRIEAYVTRERAYDCAGGFRCEGLGVALFERMRGDDPTSLIGLPLIALCRMLREEGIEPLLA